MVPVVGMAFMVMRMVEAMRVGMVMGAFGRAAGFGMVVHGAGVPLAGGHVNRGVIA